jgi:hypothetical protein
VVEQIDSYTSDRGYRVKFGRLLFGQTGGFPRPRKPQLRPVNQVHLLKGKAGTKWHSSGGLLRQNYAEFGRNPEKLLSEEVNVEASLRRLKTLRNYCFHFQTVAL